MHDSRDELERLLERHADDVADAALLAGVAAIEKGCADARVALEYRWRSYPRGELRALRRQVQFGLVLCRIGMLIAEADRERFERELDLAQELAAQARRRR